MTQREIRALLPVQTPAYFGDATYAKPTLNWLQTKFWDWFSKWRWEMGLNKWTRKHDCDNFARAYVSAAHDCHALTTGDDSEGLAVGELWYVTKVGPHAIVCAVTDHGLIFIEPQNNHQLILTQSELDSCFFVHF